MENNTYPFVNLPLPYEYDALEPYIDARTMAIHHERYAEAYVTRLNMVLADYPGLQALTLEQLIQNADSLPKALQVPIRNYAGGIYNHRLYFNGLAPPSDKEPKGKLLELINSQYGSLTVFKEILMEEALSVFGSGYTWLIYDKGRLVILTSPNQNTPVEQKKCTILNLDVWEHAYYLKHYNRRGDYIADWFNVVNWDKANENFLECVRQQFR
ncbi:superoxide dismutase [Anaerotignum sp. MB30-C6]|uniref:superoxide dismutase n=1 Tax=Anaerotignum sp. MB30-C6 TaxID=3070814 RepID=UPI0027DCD3F0|nr:superoxide dismutase [Anaerotignum sp. MB30-C6]WMI81890.1 superoxide dismutase [Anaerotignum sp. MB30-C6]